MSDQGFNLPTAQQAIGRDGRGVPITLESVWYRFFLYVYRRLAALGVFTVNSNVTATGSTQADATPLSAVQNAVFTVAPGSGVILPNNPVGSDGVVVFNADPANNLNVYPPVGHTIIGLAMDAPFVLAPGIGGSFFHTQAVQWGVL